MLSFLSFGNCWPLELWNLSAAVSVDELKLVCRQGSELVDIIRGASATEAQTGCTSLVTSVVEKSFLHAL